MIVGKYLGMDWAQGPGIPVSSLVHGLLLFCRSARSGDLSDGSESLLNARGASMAPDDRSEISIDQISTESGASSQIPLSLE